MFAHINGIYPTRSLFLAVINMVLPCQVLVNVKAKKFSHLDKFNWLSFNAEIIIYVIDIS